MTFNLLDNPWISVQGGTQTVTLVELFQQAHNIDRLLGDTPLTGPAILRMCVAVAQRVYAPKNKADWLRVWEQGKFGEEIAAYLELHRDRFDMFDMRMPFYQDALVPDRSDSPPTKLVLGWSSGSNTTLFDTHIDWDENTVPLDVTARQLVTVQTWGPGGLSGWNRKSFSDAPWARGLIFIIQGKSLFETIWLNTFPAALFACEPETDIPDAPAWEQEYPFSPVRSQPLGLLDYLTWQTRRVVLFPGDGNHLDSIRWIPGHKLAKSLRAPYKVYRPNRQRVVKLLYAPENLGWQHVLPHILGDYKPMNVRWVLDELGMDMERITVHAVGLAGDKARIDAMPSITFNVRLGDAVHKGFSLAQDAHDLLRKAAYAYAAHVSGGARNAGNTLNAWGVDEAFWAHLQAPFALFMRTQETTDLQSAIIQAARDSLAMTGCYPNRITTLEEKIRGLFVDE